MPPQELRLRILTAEPLAGLIILADGEETRFDGWTGLAIALQTALVADDQPASAPASPSRPGTSSLP